MTTIVVCSIGDIGVTDLSEGTRYPQVCVHKCVCVCVYKCVGVCICVMHDCVSVYVLMHVWG